MGRPVLGKRGFALPLEVGQWPFRPPKFKTDWLTPQEDVGFKTDDQHLTCFSVLTTQDET